MNSGSKFVQRVKFKPRTIFNGREVDAGAHVQPYLGRVFEITKITTTANGNVVVKLGGDHAPTAWIDIKMLDFLNEYSEETDAFTDEDRDHYDRAFKSLFLNA